MSDDRAVERHLNAYRGAEESLLGLIRGARGESKTPTERRQRAIAKLDRTRRLLQTLGNPQHQYPTIHVTGTSGKGSTSTLIACMLTAAGYRVGLRTSPYLQVATEKLQIGGNLIDGVSFRDLTQHVLAHAESGRDNDFGYTEAWSAISFQWFAKREVDLAVIEVGAGGRFDSTNVIEPIVSVVTSVGMDHVISLGPTLADIAWHKAGIIKQGGLAVVGALPAEARGAIDQRAAEVGARIVEALPPDSAPLPAMSGDFQRFNAAVATATVTLLMQQGYVVPDAAILQGMASARLPGRLERMPSRDDPDVWIDGAHNADKIAAVAREAHLLGSGAERPVVVLGLLASKGPGPILDALIPVASAFVTTQPTVVGKSSLPAARLMELIRDRGFAGDVHCDPRPLCALDRAVALAERADTSVLVTGSLYLAGELRSRWFSNDEIVIQRTPWPR